MEAPDRQQLVIRVSPDVKAQLVGHAAQLSVSVTRLVERAATAWDRATLERLQAGHRDRYLASDISASEAFGVPARERPKRVARARVSVDVTVEAREALGRYAKFYGLSQGEVMGILARRLMRTSGGGVEKETLERILVGAIDREEALAASDGMNGSALHG